MSVTTNGCNSFQSARDVAQGNRGNNRITENTLRDYFELFQQGGIEKWKEKHYSLPESELKKPIVSLEAYFPEHPPATIKQAQQEVELITGVVLNETKIRDFLKKT